MQRVLVTYTCFRFSLRLAHQDRLVAKAVRRASSKKNAKNETPTATSSKDTTMEEIEESTENRADEKPVNIAENAAEQKKGTHMHPR